MTKSQAELVVIIPARNEIATITEIVKRTIPLGYHVLVIDDASSDGTALAAHKAGAEVLTLKHHHGNLRSIQAGMAWMMQHHKLAPQWLATMDADGQHAPEDLPLLLEQAKTKPQTVIIGSCPERSSWMRQLVWAFFRRLTGLKIRDMTSGFKIYPHPAITCLCNPKGQKLTYQDLPSLLFLLRQGFKLAEIPVQMAPRRLGASRVFSSWNQVAIYMFRVTGACLIYRLKNLLRPQQTGEKQV